MNHPHHKTVFPKKRKKETKVFVLFCTDGRNFPSCVSACGHNPSVTGSVFPSILPSLIHTGAIELGLSQTNVGLIVNAAEPLGKSVAASGVRLIGFQSVSEVFCTLITGVKLREKVDELPHLLLLAGSRFIRVICCHGVQKGPSVPSQLLPVKWTLRVLLWF